MKTRMYKLIFWMLVCFFVACQNINAAGTRTINLSTGSVDKTTTKYVNSLDSSFIINTGALLPVKLTYMVMAEANIDYLEVYDINNSDVETLIATIRGNGSSAINSNITTNSFSGKVKFRIVTSIYNCYPTAGYGFTISWASATGYTASTSYTYNNNTILPIGKVGINTSSPLSRLEVNSLGMAASSVFSSAHDDMHIIGRPDAASQLHIVGGGNGAYYRPLIYGTKIRGNANAPTSVVTGDINFSIVGSGYNGTSVVNSATINMIVDSAVTSTEVPQAITFETSKTGTRYERMRITNSGLVGINTTTPKQSLSVNGNLSLFQNNITPQESYKGSLMITKPATSGQFINLTRLGQVPWSIGYVYNTNNFAIGQGTTTDASFTTPSFVISQAGNVGIGSNTPSAKLDVNGKIRSSELDVKGLIRATEIKVLSVDSFPDYVFEENYILPQLTDVSSFINKNGHLPEIPSAQEVKEKGINLVEMQVKLLRKIEELTLYTIEQQRRIEQLELLIGKNK